MVATGIGRGNRFAKDLFDDLPRRYDLLAEVLSFGQNRRWRRAMVDRVVATGPERILDVATGTCGVALSLADRTQAWIAALDLTDAMLTEGRARVARRGLEARITLLVGRGEQLPFPDGLFDALTFTYLLRYVDDPFVALRELARVVKPGGRVASLEFHVPENPFLRASWWMYTRALLPAAGWATGGSEWRRVGAFLGTSISSHYRRYPLGWTIGAWRRAGLVDVGIRRMSLGGGLVMWGTKTGD